MDAKVGDWVVTPRIGKPVEVQAPVDQRPAGGADLDPAWAVRAEQATESFGRRFWNPETGCLFDVVDADFEPGRNDPAVRPNQIFAVGGLPAALLGGTRAASVLAWSSGPC